MTHNTHTAARRLGMALFSARCLPLLPWTALALLSASWPPGASSFKVAEGGVASLSCQYSVKRFGLSRVCWGRSCGTFWCSDILVQTDENGLISKVTDRYRLAGDVLDGQMDLSILNVRRTDSGPYCCRVNVDGIFNDKKVVMNLRVVKGPGTPPGTTPSTTRPLTEQATSAPGPSPTTWRNLLSSHLELFRRNSTPLHSEAVMVEDSAPALSLQIKAPVLSLSLCLLLLTGGSLLLLAFKRTQEIPAAVALTGT